jgi:DNA-binding HxlR family transcriptional regulator
MKESCAPTIPASYERIALSEKMARGDLLAAGCPSREVLRHVTSSWGVLVLMALETGTHRFSELRRGIGGVSERMLAQTLQQLEGDGFVLRVAYAVVPPHVEYSLTPLGAEAAEKVRGLADWIELNLDRIVPHWAGAPTA